MEPEVRSPQAIGTLGDGTLMGMIKAKDDEIKQMIKDQAKEYYENIQKKKAWEQELAEEKRKVKELQELRNDQERRISWIHEENLKLKQQQNWGKEQLIKDFEQKIEEARKDERKALDDKVSQLEEKIRKYEEERFEREFPPLVSPNMLVALEEMVMEPQIREQVANVVLETEVVRSTAANQESTQPKGGIRIEGDEITIYKKITKFKTSNQAEISQVAIEELKMDELEYQATVEESIFHQEINPDFKRRFEPVLRELKDQGYIGEEPLKHWKKNGELCNLDIINPDITIEDKLLKDVTPAMEASFKNHIDSLLKLGVIRPSKSRHKTMAMMVNLGTSIDLVTGVEVKGKQRMVFNYRSLNDNTYKDQYSLPGINTIIQKVGNAKVFLKFDLKSGFHQVAMEEGSIP
ncbi:hypothetical protein Tco_0979709 [Tanacetum coccineum]